MESNDNSSKDNRSVELNPTKGLYKNITILDLNLASIYYPILIELGKENKIVTYGELISLARELHPDDLQAKNAVPVSSGRSLDVIRQFTNERKMPDLTCLVVNAKTKEPGPLYPGNWAIDKVSVAEFDWNLVAKDFDAHIKNNRDFLVTKKKSKSSLSESEAKEIMWNYYKIHESELLKQNNPTKVSVISNSIVRLLMDGVAVEEAFKQAYLEK